MDINNLTAEELVKELFGKELNSKKTILEYIEELRVLKTDEIHEEKVQETYNLVYRSIENLGGGIKPNTKMFLKNNLKSMLGRKVKDKDPVEEENGFIKFFKMAYPKGERRKDFTWVLMDINKITNEQIWTTLTCINREILKRTTRITRSDKEDILEMVEKLVDRNEIKYINQIRSLEKLTKVLKIKVVERKGRFDIEEVVEAV